MRYLFERIVSPGQPDSIELIKEDVRSQVQRLIDSHQINHYRGGIDILNLASPSVTEIGTNALSEQESYALTIARIVKRFEPRLVNPVAQVIPAINESCAPQLLIEAELRIDGLAEPFQFVSEVEGI